MRVLKSEGFLQKLICHQKYFQWPWIGAAQLVWDKSTQTCTGQVFMLNRWEVCSYVTSPSCPHDTQAMLSVIQPRKHKVHLTSLFFTMLLRVTFHGRVWQAFFMSTNTHLHGGTPHTQSVPSEAIQKMYLCQWQLPQGTTQQWRKEEELLDRDSILLEHNILCMTQYHKKQTKQKTIQTYANLINHTKSKDNKYIHPPLKITNLKLSTQECNPDKDIQTNQPTIQIQNSEVNIYDHRGKYMATGCF